MTMPKLELEVTEELMRKIEEAAKESLVTPSHWATCKLKDNFLEKEKPMWLPAMPPILRNLASTLEAMIADQVEKE